MHDDAVKATVYPLYAVPIVDAWLPGAERLNPELHRLFLQLESEGDRHRDPIRRDTQYGLFESNFQLHQRTEPAVRTLFAFIDETLRSFVTGISEYSPQDAARLDFDYHMWFHITRKGGYQGLHNHANASWSGIYCIDPGDPGAPGSQSGEVRFHDPRTGSDMYRDPANERLMSPYRLGPWQLGHKAGKLIIFPSYLLHEIFPYTGERPRVIVAFNAWCRWRT